MTKAEAGHRVSHPANAIPEPGRHGRASSEGATTLAASITQLQRLAGNRTTTGAVERLRVQRKLTYDSDWLTWKGLAWNTGAKELWGRVQPRFDDPLAPTLKRLGDLARDSWMSEDHKTKVSALVETWGKYDSEKIPMATGEVLATKLEALITEASALETAVKKGVGDELDRIERSMSEVTTPFFSKYSTWKTMGIEGLADARQTQLTLVTDLNAKRRPKPAASQLEIEDYQTRAKAVVKKFTDSEGSAATAQARLTLDKQTKLAQQELAAKQPKEKPPEGPKDALLEKLLGNRSLAQGLRSTGASDDELLKLLNLGKITSGRLQEALRFAAAAKIEDLLKLTSDEWLVKLLRAIGSSGHEDELAGLLTSAPKQEAALESLIGKVAAGSLATVKAIIDLFPAGNTRATDAAALFGATTKGEEAQVLAILQRVGQAEAVKVAEVLPLTTAAKLNFMIDPTKAAHAFAFVHAELKAGNKIWGGETCAEPDYKLADGTATDLANVRAQSYHYGANGGYPAPNSGRFASDRYNNYGGATDMKLPTNTTYTEYDIREFTSPGARGLARVVIGANGHKYYTSNHYTSFAKF